MFISAGKQGDRQDSRPRVTEPYMSPRNPDPNAGLDFEVYRDKYGFTDEEMNWKRFCFHGGYSLGAWVHQINDSNLVIRESEWMLGKFV